LPILTIKSLLSYIACHDSLDPLFQNLGIWIQGSGTVGHVSSATYFSNLLEHKDTRLKIKLTLSLILRVNLRLGGYSIWSASFIATPYKRRLHNYSGHEHLTASMQPRKYSEVRENSKMPPEVLGRLQCSTSKSSGAYQTCAHRTVHVAYFS
jgi:hypothetical protein